MECNKNEPRTIVCFVFLIHAIFIVIIFRSVKLLFRKLFRKFAMETKHSNRSIALTTNNKHFICVIIIVRMDTSVVLKIIVVLNSSTTMKKMHKRTNDWIVLKLVCCAMTQSFLSCVLFLYFSGSLFPR